MQVNTSSENGSVVLPTFVPLICKVIFWVFLTFSVGLYLTAKNKRLLFMHWLIVLFYFIPFMYAIASQTEILRYALLLLCFFSIPFSVSFIIQRTSVKKILNTLNIIIILVFGLGLLLNISTFLNGQRFQGIFYNPNMYGFLCVFWLTILLIDDKTTKKKTFFFRTLLLVIILFTLFLSGSRTSFAAVLIVLLFTFYNRIKNIVLPVLLLSAIFYLVLDYFNLGEIVERYSTSGNLAQSSGRATYWNKVYNYLRLEPWWGYGMDAPDKLVNSNIHNNYLRYLFTMGRFFTLFTLIPLVLFYGYICKKFLNKIPNSLIGFVLAYAVLNFGEDYFIGVTSTSSMSFAFVLGIMIYYIKSYNTNENLSNIE